MPTYEHGLTSAEARSRLTKYGLNVLPEKPKPSDFSIFLAQLKSPLVYILIAAGVITFLLREFADTAIITLAVVINTILGFIQERRAEKAFEALEKLIQPHARVTRDGKLIQVDSKEIVLEDLVILSAGDKVPADGRLIEANRLFISEAILTGESESVEKKIKDKVFTSEARKDEVFMGTIVTAGTAKFVVEKTGKDTQMGKIAQKVQTIDDDTPLRQQLRKFAKQLSIVVFILTVLVFVIGLLVSLPILEIFTTSVALAVSAIPEGLLVGLTVVLAIGMQRILRRKGLVRNLLSAETLGGVTTICVDKTGTLTQGKMEVVKTFGKEEDLKLQSIIANDMDDPTIIAVMEWALRLRSGQAKNELLENYKRLDSIPFSSKNKFFACLNKWDKQNNVLFVNGAPEVLLGWSDIPDGEKQDVEKTIAQMSESGYRVIGMARRFVGSGLKDISDKDIKGKLGFVGLLALSDPVREGVSEALVKTQKAGIDLVVITGDYPSTAVKVMHQLGIEVKPDSIIDGESLSEISKAELAKLLKTDRIKIFARTTPDQKIQIVDALQANGEVVAMMGDGVNDAPALRSADIGIVVGEATEVAKETSDLVLLDSNYETILAAIEEGRGIFANIRKIILYLVSDAFEEILAVIGTLVLALPLPVTAAQILWINLISDGFPNLALTVDPAEKDAMNRPPRPPSEPLLANWMKAIITIVSLTGGVFALLLFVYFYKTTNDIVLARSVAFIAIGVNSLIYVFSIRTLTDPFWHENPFDNKWLNIAVIGGLVLQFVPFVVPQLKVFFELEFPGTAAVALVFGAGILMFVIIEVMKAVVRRQISWFQH